MLAARPTDRRFGKHTKRWQKPVYLKNFNKHTKTANTPVGGVTESEQENNVAVKRRTKTRMDTEVEAMIAALVYEEGAFQFIVCSRTKANQIQRWLYSVNIDNVCGIVYATRYNCTKGGLLVWRMA